MSTTAQKTDVPVFNIANQLTIARLILSIVMFALLSFEQYVIALVVFLVAVSTDWLDGYFARKYGLVTVLGRILDPFVDKIIICGAFVYLAAVPGSRIVPWMAVVVVGRELLVTAIRGFLEQQGKDFSANMLGKVKMVLQCAAVALSLWLVGAAEAPAWLATATLLTAWAAIVITIASGLVYIQRGVSLAGS
jgi:CDP-diacylglycerol--glycerol-3-phosphate 3-phosphatidyltransferase